MRSFEVLIPLIVLIAAHLQLAHGSYAINLNSGFTLTGEVIEKFPCQTDRPCQGCGNGVCDYPAESCVSCPSDCGACAPCVTLCGNGVCEGNETSCSCPADCGVCCVDGVCRADLGETYENCASDCTVAVNITIVNAANFKILPGATVMCTSANYVVGPVISDSGFLQYTNLPSGIYTCSASLFSFYPNQISIYTAPSIKNVSTYIALSQEAGVVEGIATDESTGLALPGVQVYCYSGSYATATISTDSMGQFVFPGLNPGSWSCWGSLTGYAPNFNNGTLLNGAHVRIDLSLRPVPAAVIGNVVQQYTNAPVLAPFVTCVQPGLARYLVGNSQGSFTLDNAIAGPVTCTVTKPGYITQSASSVVPPGQTIVFNYILQALPSVISGNVYDAYTLLPIVNTSVACTQGSLTPLKGVSSATGNYSIAAVVGLWTCTASATGWYNRTSSIEVLPGQSFYLPFVLEPIPASIVGTVTDTNNNPVYQAVVVCQFTLIPNSQANLGPQNSNSTGMYSFPNIVVNSSLPFLNFVCQATKVGFGAGSKTGVLQRGSSLNVVIQLIEFGINAVVSDALSNAPVAGATVTCSGPSTATGTSAGDGSVLFTGINVGTYNCTATLVGYTSGSSPIVISASAGIVPVTLLVEVTTYNVHGEVVDAITGKPLPSATLVVRDSTDTLNLAALVISANGTWATQLPLPATYYFAASNGPNYLTVDSSIALNPQSAANPLSINIVPSASTIVGSVDDNTTSISIANVLLNLFQATQTGNVFVASQVSALDGTYTFPHINKGSYVLTASFVGYVTSSISITVSQLGISVTVPVSITPNIFGAVTGRVIQTLSGGVVQGIAGVNVTILTVGESITATWNTTASDGTYYFAAIPQGSSTIYASIAGYQPNSVSLSVVVATVNTVSDIILSPLTGSVSGNLFKLSGGNRVGCNCFATVVIYPAGVVPIVANAAGSIIVPTSNPTYSFPALPQGQYFIVATNQDTGLSYTTATFTIAASGALEVDIQVA